MADLHFFANCALGLEETLRSELERYQAFCLDVQGRLNSQPFQIVSVEKGGVEFSAAWEVGLGLNHWLKVAGRILLRLARFPAQSPARMQDRLRDAKLRNRLHQIIGDSAVQISVEANHCQIHNEKQIRRWVSEIFAVDENSPFLLLLRGVDDQWTLSIDTSGEHLHKRGLRQMAGAAPLRETLAAATLRFLLNEEPWQKRREVHLLDPMAGAGTFLREAANLERPVISREFAFQKFKNCPKILLSPLYWQNLSPEWRGDGGSAWAGLHAGEIDERIQRLLEPLGQQLDHFSLHKGDSWLARNRADWKIPEGAPVWVVVNPPYGERLQGVEWIEKIAPWAQSLGVEKLALWCPEKLKSDVLRALDRAPVFEVHLSNGGIPCSVMVFSLVRVRSSVAEDSGPKRR